MPNRVATCARGVTEIMQMDDTVTSRTELSYHLQQTNRRVKMPAVKFNSFRDGQ